MEGDVKMRAILSCLALGFLLGCTFSLTQKNNSTDHYERKEAYDIFVDFQVGFDNDFVVFYLNDQEVFSGTLLSHESDGLAKWFTVKTQKKQGVKIDIHLNNTDVYSFTVNLKNGSYLGIYKDEDDGKIYLEQSHKGFLYD